MTTEEKLIALGFQRHGGFNSWFEKKFTIKDNVLKIVFYPLIKVGDIFNQTTKQGISINFTELLKWNDFYEKKQFRRFASRDASRNDSETQDNIQRA